MGVLSLLGVGAGKGTAPVTPCIVATGGTITTSGGYKIHTFTGTGFFNVTSVGVGATAEYLVVGGGGAGGNYVGGGGGGGGVLSGIGYTLTIQNYIIAIGSGGLGTSDYTTLPGDGSNSSFDGIIAIGGGRGAGGTPTPYIADNGGSGGGANFNNPKGLGTLGQGNDGGNAVDINASGGGGGASSVGSDPIITTGGDGGSGFASSISGALVMYGGGGGGSGSVIGGNGANGGNGQYYATDGPATDGTPNTGNGGGGNYFNNTSGSPSGNGADGIVIIRYLDC